MLFKLQTRLAERNLFYLQRVGDRIANGPALSSLKEADEAPARLLVKDCYRVRAQTDHLLK